MPKGVYEPRTFAVPPEGMQVAEDGSFRFAKGNELWKLAASRVLRKPMYEDPQVLLIEVCGYFNWLTENPLHEAKLVSYEGVSNIESVPKMRAATLDGLLLYLGIARETWGSWRRGSQPALSDVILYAEQFIREQKFTGAAAGLLNPMIIARDLGLAEKAEHSGPDGGPIEVSARDAILDKLAGLSKRAGSTGDTEGAE